MHILCTLIKNYIMKNYSISIRIDKRRLTTNNDFPIRLCVYNSTTQKQKFYKTPYNFTEEQFKSIWENPRPRKENKDIKIALENLKAKAQTIADSLNHFNFEDFERLFMSKESNHKQDVVYYYNKIIDEYQKQTRLGTASSYKCSLNSLLKFHEKKSLDFYTITPSWLKKYENWMLENEQSITTVGIYLRPLRAIFNLAINDKTILNEIYPFGKNRYEIKASRSTKKTLSKEDLKTLFEIEPKNEHQIKAKAFWFFSYFCNGMNIKDISLLKHKNIVDDKFTFVRAKTANTRKEQRNIEVILNSFTKEVISKYGNKNVSPNDYVFTIITNNDSPHEQFRKIQAFTKFINQHIKLFAKSVGVNAEISTYWARHSFATNAVRNGASMEFAMEALGHSSMETTKNYFAGFEDKTKREVASKLLNFN